MKRLYTLFALIIASLAAVVLPVAAGLDPEDPSINSISFKSCHELVVRYSVGDNDYGVNWTLSEADEDFVADGSFDTEANTKNNEVILTGFTLVPGEDYMIDLEWGEFKGTAFFTFTAGVCDAAEETSSKPVELPPCEIEDTRLDEGCGSTFVVTYAQDREDGCYISIYSVYGRADRKPVLVLQATPGEIAAAQANGGNAIIDSADVVNLEQVTIYWLSATGEFQVNAGPNEEGKVYVLNFTGCPATNIYTSNSYQKAD